MLEDIDFSCYLCISVSENHKTFGCCGNLLSVDCPSVVLALSSAGKLHLLSLRPFYEGSLSYFGHPQSLLQIQNLGGRFYALSNTASSGEKSHNDHRDFLLLRHQFQIVSYSRVV